MTCIVAYDIENDRIRTRLSKYLEKSNGKRLQKSVFALELERYAFGKVMKGIEKIAGKQGKVAIFRLCPGCEKSAIQMAEEEKKFYIF